MKKTLLFALLLTFAAGAAIAQQYGRPGFYPGGMGMQHGMGMPGSFYGGSPVDRLTEYLELDEAQAAAVALILKETQLLRDEERDRTYAVSDEIRLNTQAQIREVLSPEQQATFDEMLKLRDEMRQAHHGATGAEYGFGGAQGMHGMHGFGGAQGMHDYIY